MGLLDRAKLSIDWKALNPFNRTLLTLGIEGGSVRLLASEGRTVLGWLSTPFNPRMVSDGRIETTPTAWLRWWATPWPVWV